ncbi:FixH family protein [Novosphingobium profundi]|uniref:FixH family protein n=1 Tax=Novosphingobium profundi TaxID=1774954 RepID=UPI001BD9DB2B|nr:FixH family protein [Novosphingobium profundi]MBT0669986.1 FixH family protein [Novosphingobium profundi]
MMAPDKRAVKRFTGWHMTWILLAAFAVVLGVNVLMATLANTTFGGIVVENSYVASQKFNTWLDEARREKALGWQVKVSRRGDGRLDLALTGAPEGARVEADAWHPLGRLPDVPMTFAKAPGGDYVGSAVLPEGRWTLRIRVKTPEGQVWRIERSVL